VRINETHSAMTSALIGSSSWLRMGFGHWVVCWCWRVCMACSEPLSGLQVISSSMWFWCSVLCWVLRLIAHVLVSGMAVALGCLVVRLAWYWLDEARGVHFSPVDNVVLCWDQIASKYQILNLWYLKGQSWFFIGIFSSPNYDYCSKINFYSDWH